MSAFPRLQWQGDSALLVTLGDRIDEALNQRVYLLASRLNSSGLPGLGECVPGYATLLVHFDPLAGDVERLSEVVLHALDTDRSGSEVFQPRRIEVPVWYGGAFGPDLEDVARHTGLPPDEVIRLHCSRDYPVYIMGFTPGFPYLGGMDVRLATPRLATPRTRIPAGSVGIAGEQTGIYPQESPGGWRIIGRTPLRLFDLDREIPCLLAPGDRVRFVPLPADEGGAHV